MNQIYKTWDQLPLMMNAEQVAMVLEISRAGAYQILHREDFPCIRLGKRMMVRREAFLRWLEAQQKGATTE